MLGRLLAREHPVDADIVVPVPDSGVPAAVGCALDRRFPFAWVLFAIITSPHVHRASQAIRNFGVKLKLNPIRGLIEGKRVILVDDSIVRGTTSRKIVRMVAKWTRKKSTCASVVRRRFHRATTRGYATREELIASSNTPEEICQIPRRPIPSAMFRSRRVRQALSDTEGKFCTSCYTGLYPTDLVQWKFAKARQRQILRRGNRSAANPFPRGAQWRWKRES